jgi:excinuclease ABC subunit C
MAVDLQNGIEVIRSAAAELSGDRPGVYRMLGEKDEVLYVGKAKSLKKRVSSYTRVNGMPYRLQRMVAQTQRMEFVYTHTESEALLLEANLIKQLKPRYNILLRDDKSFPYILLRSDHDFPTVVKHRGAKKKDGTYFGPFAGAGIVNRTLKMMHKIFMLRNCSDTVFANRARPCLQYHIKRCSAPCVGYVSKAEYGQQVQDARDFLEGRSEALQERFRGAMEQASVDMQYEEAALYRDRLKALVAVQARQDIHLEAVGDVDVVALAQEGGQSCVQVFFFRAGQNFGNYAYFPRHQDDESAEDILGSFLAQFYLSKPVPREVLVSDVPSGKGVLEQALGDMAGRKVTISKPQRGQRRKALDFAAMNAREALLRRVAERKGEEGHLQAVAELFDMDAPPGRIEVYDNSHISGSHMVGAMVVAGPEGFQKSAYRKFNIKHAEAADDYGMMREVMSRRFRKVLDADAAFGPGSEEWPDLLLIDGGKGQLSSVCEVLAEYGILDDLTVVAIAKGEDRSAGREQFFMPGRERFDLPVSDSRLHYLQRLRDEAHRFAVGAHRTRRKKAISDNPLDDVPGIGAKKKSALLRYFGSAKAVRDAGVADLQKVEGVSKNLAQQIYDHFRN